MEEKIIQMTSGLDTQVNKTVYLVLTNTGKMFVTYDLEKWDFVPKPNFNNLIRKFKDTKLYG